MRRLGTILLVLAMAAAGCGGDDDSSDEDNTGGNGDNDEVVGGDPDFSLSQLPGDFSEFVPPQWDTGAYSELTGFPTVSFESSLSFEDAVDHYNDVYGGEGTVVGDAPERLAQWTRTPPWVISVFDGDPVIIGISKVED